MRAITLSVLGVLGACVSVGGIPAQTGMTISEHAATCTDGGRQIVSDFIGVLVGECTAKPDEYVVFTQGKVSHVYTSDEIADAMLLSCPADLQQQCENDIRSRIAQRTEAKWQIAADLYAAKSQRMNDALRQMSETLLAMDGSSYSSALPAGSSLSRYPAPQSGPLISDTVSGFNRICVYDVLGSASARTIPSTQLCPLWGH